MLCSLILDILNLIVVLRAESILPEGLLGVIIILLGMSLLRLFITVAGIVVISQLLLVSFF